MADGVKVDLDALSTFARAVGASADGHLASTADSAAMTQLTGMMRTLTGAQDLPANMCVDRVGFLEAQDFATRHAAMAQSAQQFLDDALNGMIALGSAAETCAVRYATTDAANAALMRTVVPSSGSGPFERMALPVSGTAVVSSDAVSSAFDPGPSDAAPTLGGASVPAGSRPSGPPAAASPADAAFRAEVEKKVQGLRDGRDIDSGPGRDLGDGMTLGRQPDQLVVPPDAARMPVHQPTPTPVTPDAAG